MRLYRRLHYIDDYMDVYTTSQHTIINLLTVYSIYDLIDFYTLVHMWLYAYLIEAC